MQLDYSLYELLEAKKDCGAKLEFDNVTYDELYQLSITENIPDTLIGDLFNIEPKVVRKKRYKLGIKL